MAERGVYWEMLIEQWLNRFLPDDVQGVADAIATTPEQVAEVLAAWPVVRRKFVEGGKGKPRIYNTKLERTRRKQHEKLQIKSEAGRKAGEASAAKRRQQNKLDTNDRSTPVNDRQQISVVKVSVVKGSSEEQEQKSSAADAPRLPSENVSIVTKIAHEVLDIGTGSADLPEAIKSLCAKRKIAYDSETVRKAIESAQAQRKRKAS